MNKIFKVIWNPATGSYSVVSETTKSRGKKSGRSKLLVSALVAGGLLSPVGAHASVTLDGGTNAEEAAGGTPLGDNWIAIGQEAVASSDTMGTGTMGSGSVAVGARANAGVGSTAIGFSSNSSGERSVALGQSTVSTGSRSIAIGSAAQAISDYTLALGNSAHANSDYAMALGKDTNANGLYSLAIGYNSKTSKDNAIALGANSKADGTDSLALGRLSVASAANAIAMGADTEAAENATAIGFNANAIGKSSLALGDNANANNTNAIAIGQGSVADKVGSIALGSNSKSAGENAIALGNSSNAGGKNSLAFGFGATANGDNAVAIGANSSAGADNTVSVGSSSLKRKIVNMGNGDINNVSSDAINGSQLYAISKSVSDRLGGYHDDPDNVINSDGTLKAPTYYLQSGQYNNVGEALQSIDNNTLHWDEKNKGYSASHTVFNADGTTKSVQAQSIITNVADGTVSASSFDAVNGSQLYDLKQDALLWNGTAFSAKHGANGTDSVITNVANGTVSASSKDAVNGSQLKTTQDDVDINTANIATNTSNIATNTADIATNTAGIAANTTNIATNTSNIATNTADIATNTTDIAANTTDIATNTSNIATNTTDIATNTSNITALNADVDTLEKDALLWNGSAFSAKHGTNATSKITNVTAGDLTAASTDAVNGSQLYNFSSAIADYLGGGSSVDANGMFSAPTYTIGGTDYDSVGDALAAINSSVGTSLGDALMWDNSSRTFSASRAGTASKITNVAAGELSATSTDVVNGSQLYGVSNSVVDALGGGSTMNADGTINAPTYSIANTDYSNIGDALSALDASMDDALVWDSATNAFSAAHGTDATSKITNVAAGALSATSTDAVNGSQLYGVGSSVVDVLGGGSTINADGTINAPTYSIANTDYSNIGDALSAIDASLDDSLLWDASAGAFSAAHGTDTASKITNVANGRIAADSTDAVNGSQLFTTNQMITQIAGNTSNTYVEEHGAGVNYIRTNDTGLVFEDAMASGIGATAVGYNSVASATGSVAIGQDSSSDVESGIALGSGSVSDRVIVKGSRNTSVTGNGVVIGYDTTDGELLGALSIGDDGKYRQIINVADGSEAHDAVTVRQLQNAIGSVATTPTKYYHANSTAEDSLAVGEDSLAIGAKTIVNGDAGIGIGLNTLVLADAINGIAIGSNAHANHANSIAMGNGSETTRGAQTGYTAYNMDAPQNSVGEFSVGSEDGQRQITNVAAGSQDTDAVNVGQLKVTDAQVAQNTQSITNLNTQVGNLDTRVTTLENGMGDIITTGSTKYFKTNTDGVDANAQGKDSVAIGSGSIAAADNSVALGTGSEANEENTVSVGSSTNQRRITNVAAGKNDTDAVNVAQLKSSEAGSVRYDTKSDGSVDYSNISLGDGKGGTTRISNVSAGVNNNDAVNYAQLKQSVQETKQYTDQRMVEMDNKLSKTESKLSGGIASAMAMTGLPQAYTPGASMTSIGGGTYNGESAVALGVSMVSANGRWVYKLQGSTNSQGEYSAAIGAGIQW
ncbi:YadA-like family protein [Escherichia albertii]|uniref:YadA-like family protein n=2 Tax=Escherichia albertii TaxID=208962 RepID=UPI00074367B6|nr:YadA-like family protein [Escherichia albertii]EHG7529139.1 adhesin [Escherichia albertii]MCV3267364.1 YadA-like family protein [Escherichia albertii]MCZ8692272.1 YadA-like family protein [Escherichia albertii]MCZ8918991.1 YadA-like family protein [Escherichia albertii]HCS7457295.1 YadA-like family protein [Escherichia albertii]